MIDPVERDIADHADRLAREDRATNAASECHDQVVEALVSDKTAVVARERDHLGDEKHARFNFLDALDWLEDQELPETAEILERVNGNGGVDSLSMDERRWLVETWSKSYNLLDLIQDFQESGGGYIALVK